MYVFAFALQLVALLAALGGGGLALLQLWQNREDSLALVEKAHLVISGALLLASALLLHALFWNDFSVVYVASYTDRVLPVFYRLTAFWAGQPGSMSWWALVSFFIVFLASLVFLWRRNPAADRLAAAAAEVGVVLCALALATGMPPHLVIISRTYW